MPTEPATGHRRQERRATAREEHGVDPGRSLPHGLGRLLPRGAPVHPVSVDGFWMDEHPVTVAEFRRFVKATGHVTVAEQAPDPADYPDADPELLVPGSGVFRMPPGPVPLDDVRNWWHWVPGADWRHPEGPGSSLDGRDRAPRHPGHLVRRFRLPGLGRQGAPHRGRVGAGRPGRARGRGLHLGRRVRARRSDHGQHLARAVPVGEPERADSAARRQSRASRPTATGCTTWPATSGSGRTTTTRPATAGRPRATAVRRRRAAAVLRARTTLGSPQPDHSYATGRPGAAPRPPGDEGRLAPLRAQLLPALPPGRPPGGDDGDLHHPHRLPRHRRDPG